MMMKAISTFLFALCFQLTAISQSELGIKAGIHLANQERSYALPSIYSPESLKPKALTGYMAGVFFKTKIHTRWSFSTELNYLTAGSRSRYFTEEMLMNPGGKAYYINDNVSYLELPVLWIVHYKKLYFGAGPAFSLKLASWMKAEGHHSKTDYYKSTDFSANILAGFKVSNKVDINTRYSHGLADVAEGIFTAENRLLNFSVLYRIK